MNILVPVSWLRDYLKTEVAAKTIAQLMSLSGPSVEHQEKQGEDFIFNFEVTTNRPDAYSVYGLAREAYAILKNNGQTTKLIEPDGLNLTLQPDVKEKLTLDVKIEETNLCPRFTAIILNNVKIGQSPAVIKNRLQAAGIRPINNIVDISNYVMLELGNPMHMFDYDKIKGAKMNLRKSKKGESIRTLDAQNHKLPEGSIVIEDAERIIDLCGIMGGENSQISTRTKRVLLFVQSYDPIRIRKTANALAARTEASSRFEKGIDLENIPQALSRAIFLSKKMAGAKIASELIDIHKELPKPKTIELKTDALTNYLGIELEPAKAAQILKDLGFSTRTTHDTIEATPPSWRAADVQEPVDLIEEIARIYGYHNLPSALPTGEPPKEEESELAKVISLKKALKYLGLTEVISYSIISAEFLKLTGVQPLNAVELTNPLSSEWQFMRPSIIPSLASVIAQNQNIKQNIKIFEVAKTYIKGNQGDFLISTGLPIQDLHLAIALQNSNFYEIKGLVENIFEILALPVEFQKIKDGSLTENQGDFLNFPLFEPPLSATVIASGKPIGTIGLLNQKVIDRFDIDGTATVAELNLTTVYILPTTVKSFKQIAKFPPVIEDISAIFAKSVAVADIITEVKKAGSPLVKNIEILDIYEDEKIGNNKKSVTLHLQYQLTDRTPNSEDVAPVREKIITHLQSLKAQVRKV